MGLTNTLVKEQVQFLSQKPEQLRQHRGAGLYEHLKALNLNHGHYFRALGTNIEDYCAQEFGADLRNITVERFFGSDPSAKWLFPDIVSDAVQTGMRRKPVYPQLIAGDEKVAGAAVDVPFVVEDSKQLEFRTVAEGGVIPESKIECGQRIVKLDKTGRGILASYEVIRRMSIDALRIHLQRMGEQLGRGLDARLADVLVNGDSSSANTAAEQFPSATSGSVVFNDLLGAFVQLSQFNYFTPTHILADPGTCYALMGLDELKDTNLFDTARTGQFPTPLGMKLVPMRDQPEGKITVLDAGYAVQKLTEQDLLVESDKLINQQWERTYLTVVTDFAVLYEKARVVIDTTWS